MDKVFFVDVDCSCFDILGRTVCLGDQEERQKLVALATSGLPYPRSPGESQLTRPEGFDEPWIADHLEVTAIFRPSRLPSIL